MPLRDRLLARLHLCFDWQLRNAHEFQNILNRIHVVYNVLHVLKCPTFCILLYIDLHCVTFCSFLWPRPTNSLTHDEKRFLGRHW